MKYTNIHRSLLLTIVVMLFILICVPSVLAATGTESVSNGKTAYTDLAADSPLWPYVCYMVDKGIVKGFPDGTFRPSESLTRAQITSVMVRVKGLKSTAGVGSTFSDVPSTHWAFGEIEAAAKAGVFKGYPDGSFYPDSPISRAEAVALLMRLFGGANSNKTVSISDVAVDHWAYLQVSTAVQAGLVKLSADNNFNPDEPFRRGELVRGLSVMYTIGPDLRQAELIGKLVVKKGKVMVSVGEGAPLEVTGKNQVGVNTRVTTGANSQAEIIFEDGSGIRLDPNTDFMIKKAKGFNYMRRDGSSGVAVDNLEVVLRKGRIFGALSSSQEQTEYINQADKIASHRKTVTLASLDLPADLAMVLAEGEQSGNGATGTAWWKETTAERQRVVVDMPWGICGIRGTFWMNEVVADAQRTSLITGNATVDSGSKTVAVSSGMSTIISSASAPPTASAPITKAEGQVWATAKDFVTERAQDIENKFMHPFTPGILPPEVPIDVVEVKPLPNIVPTVIKGLDDVVPELNKPKSGGGGSSSSSDTESATLPEGILDQELEKMFFGGTVYVIFPAGTIISANASITVTSLNTPPVQPTGAQVAGKIADINITGLPTGTYVKIKLKADAGSNNAAAYYYNPNIGSWEYQQESSLDQSTLLVTANVNHFSIYGVLNDTTPPMVSSTDPANNTMNVSPDKVIKVSFNETVRLVDYDSIILLPSNGNPVEITKSSGGNSGSSVLTITPASPLDNSVEYSVYVAAGSIKDLPGNELVSDYEFSFTTMPAVPSATPQIIAVTASNIGNPGLGYNDTLTIVFDVPTNQPSMSTKDELDTLIDFNAKSLGANYSGNWSDDHTLVLTVLDPEGASLVVGDYIVLKASGNLRSADNTSDVSTAGGYIGGEF